MSVRPVTPATWPLTLINPFVAEAQLSKLKNNNGNPLAISRLDQLLEELYDRSERLDVCTMFMICLYALQRSEIMN